MSEGKNMTDEERAHRWLSENWSVLKSGCGPVDVSLASLLAAVRAEERERCAGAVRSSCGPCGGTGTVDGMVSGHGCDGSAENCSETCPVPVQDMQPCEYCGRPIAAIRGEATGRGA